MIIRCHFLLATILFVVLCACDDEPTIVDQSPAAISFQVSEMVIAENGGSKVIALGLNKKLKRQGEIVIDVSSLTEGFTLNPAPANGQLNLPVSMQQDVLTFSLTPIDNSVINENGDETVIFTVSSVSDGLLIGEKKSLRVIIADDEIPATVNFASAIGRIRENNAEGIPVMLSLSHKAPEAGALTVVLTSEEATYGVDYTTVPVSADGRLHLAVELDAEQVSFKVIPLNDNLFNGNRNILVKLQSAEGGVSRGLADTHNFIITDDELSAKAKGYTIGAGSWTYKKEYAYNLDGTVAQVSWEQATPAPAGGVYRYHYDSNGNLIKSIDTPVQKTHYLWEGNRITRSERIRNGNLVEYKLYGYDDNGNVGEVTQYNIQPNGGFVKSLIFVYLYHVDGNIYKKMAYYPEDEEDDLTLISTQTYENYLDVANPFTMVEILPNKTTQLTLPLSYREEGDETDITYNFSYQFDEEGRPTKRTATSGATSEVTNYQYFD